MRGMSDVVLAGGTSGIIVSKLGSVVRHQATKWSLAILEVVTMKSTKRSNKDEGESRREENKTREELAP